MFIVKYYDYGICYLVLDEANNSWVMKASVKKAYQFNSVKSAERAYKSFYKAATGRKINKPVKSLTNIEIIEIKP